jgi:hypothetical protein
MPICKCDNSSAFGRQNEAGRVPLREKRMRYPSATLLYPVLFIAALAASARPGWTSDDVVKIGIMADMNGPLSSASGRGSVEAARMAAEEFGWSINGKRIEIISADHQNKPDLGAAIARHRCRACRCNRRPVELRRRFCHRRNRSAAEQNYSGLWTRFVGLHGQGLRADEFPLDVGHLRHGQWGGERNFRPRR